VIEANVVKYCGIQTEPLSDENKQRHELLIKRTSVLGKHLLIMLNSRLSSCQLILTEGHPNIYQKLKLAVEADDVLFALQGEELFDQILQ